MPVTAPRRAARRFDSPEAGGVPRLWRTYDRLRALDDALFARWDLTAQQYNLLRLLRAAGADPVPAGSLAERLVSRAPDVTRMLDKLEARGLVTRARSDADRRAVLVGLTPAGAFLLDELAEPLRECHEQQLGHLSAEQLATLTALLRLARGPHEPAGSPWV